MKLLSALAASALLATAGAWAKEIRPGDLRICGATQCRVVNDPGQARAFSDLSGGQAGLSGRQRRR
jgi:hypothetical protein